ncbi:MAG: N-acetylmuramic acid 6-phosphate etherase [Planctomycetota bacterium]|nr:N-acetylmuramic acid 6-phosphate etherase [Planctomycetota bacterium]
MSSPTPERRDHFETERPNPASARLDELSIAEAFDVMQREDASIPLAIAAAREDIVRAIELVADRLARGGRLVYVGAGTSGRLGVLDASECPPTFHSDPSQVLGVIAGGERALTNAVEGAEDSAVGGAADVDARAVGQRDVVFGITAGGTTPYVHGALARAKERGAVTVFLACVPREQAGDEADVSIRVVTGPEVVSGSTRLKAGTATKLVLNMVTTLAMTRLGKVHGNLMVDVDTKANAKLWQRGIALVARIVGCERELAEELLTRADGRVKVAAVMGVARVEAAEARARIERAGGFLRRALER